MKIAVISLAAFCWLTAATAAHAQASPVVVELFTSEGCSSCPPADALLMELDQKPNNSGADVIVLGEHVDYWNDGGWIDRFSSAEYSRRQADYARQFGLASSYTPQMVIDGRVQLVGNDRAGVYRDVRAAAAKPKSARVDLAWAQAGQLKVSVQLPDRAKAYALLAVTEDGLSTSVHDGENRGRTLRHTGVVRQLRPLGKISSGEFEKTVDITPRAEWNPNQLKVTVLVQKSDGSIIGASAIPYRN